MSLRRDHRNGVSIVENPRYVHRPDAQLCHDGTPCVDVHCSSCDATCHIHAGQIAGMPDSITDIEVRCPCGGATIASRSVLEYAFAYEPAGGDA